MSTYRGKTVTVITSTDVERTPKDAETIIKNSDGSYSKVKTYEVT